MYLTDLKNKMNNKTTGNKDNINTLLTDEPASWLDEMDAPSTGGDCKSNEEKSKFILSNVRQLAKFLSKYL